MVTMSYVWDRTTEVLRGRAGMLATIVALLSFLPKLVQTAVIYTQVGAVPNAGAFTPGSAATFGGVVFVVGLLVGLASLWGNLSLAAAATDPAVDRPRAFGIGLRRLPALVGLTILMIVAVILMLVPMIAIIGVSAVSASSLLRGGVGGLAAGGFNPGGGTIGAVMLYALALFVVLVWLFARLVVLVPVVAMERRGAGAFARSFELTRGLTWRIIGVLILFGIVFLVAAGAVQAVAGVVFRLILGAEHAALALFLTGAVSAAVTCAFAVVTGTFTAQLYRATSGYDVAETFR